MFKSGYSAAGIAAFFWCVSVDAQQPVHIRELDKSVTASPATFANVFNIRELPNRHLLVNDGVSRQLVELDDRLKLVRVILDSAPALTNSYGPVAAPLIAYRGDSSLFVDGASFSLLLIDQKGDVIHPIAAPTRKDFGYIASSTVFARPDGALIYRVAGSMVTTTAPAAGGARSMTQHLRDSAAIVVANFDKRTVDTLVHVKQQSGTRATARQEADGTTGVPLILINPIEGFDEWTSLVDGSIAVLREHDFHVDFFNLDGSIHSGPPLPYKWVRFDEEQKRALADTLQRTFDRDLNAAAESGDRNEVLKMTSATLLRYNPSMAAFIPRPTPKSASTEVKPAATPRTPVKADVTLSVVSANELPDYLPAFGSGALKADLNGQLWVLPATSEYSVGQQLVYDVVKRDGTLAFRVRLPAGRSIIGFGADESIYLMSRIDGGRWIVERAHLK